MPLAGWPGEGVEFRDVPVGPSRHLVRFLDHDGRVIALKEEPLTVARIEFEVLRHLEAADLPAVIATGLAESAERDTAILVTEYLAYSIQYRRLLLRFPLGPGPYRERLLDAMAFLLVDLHRAGVYWGDCSLANTLFRRDGDKIQAFLVDAETSEIHPSLSDGQRAYDLDILVENVAFGLADVAALQGRPEAADDAIAAAEMVRATYASVWAELHDRPVFARYDRHAISARVRRLNELGFAVDEIAVEPASSVGPGGIRLRVAVANRRFHARKLEKLTGLRALEGQARLLLNDISEYRAWLEITDRHPIDEGAAAERWIEAILEPTLAAVSPVVGDARDLLQVYCDVLEEKWILSERAGADVGLEVALQAYLGQGAPAPEDDRTAASDGLGLDIDWSDGFDLPAAAALEAVDRSLDPGPD